MKFIPLFVLLFLQFTIFGYSQNDTISKPNKVKTNRNKKKSNQTQWAFKVITFSSQYSNKEKSANQILGKPNVLPIGGLSPCAWAVSKDYDKTKPTSIRVAFEKPVKATQVAVAESYKAGTIEKIVLYGSDNQEKIVYQNDPKLIDINSRMLNVFFEPTPFDVIEGELFLQPKKVSDFEIDAFGISGNTDTIKAYVNVALTMKFSFSKESLGPAINTKLDEVAPIISSDVKTLYFDRKNSPENVGGVNDEDDIWFSKADTNGNWLPAVNIGSPLNNKYNNFVQSITPDGNTLLIGNVYNLDGGMAPGASISNRTKDGWSFPEKQNIKNFKNDNQFVNYFLTNDNKFLLIAMENSSSYGGLDLYVSFRTGENNWSEPQNLGAVINTAANDYSPFLASDGVTLYYSTSGISGYGKEDVFMSRRLDDSWLNWSEPQNLGNEFNTKGSETKFTIPASGEHIYFSSTENSIGLNDFFRIKLPEEVQPVDITTHNVEIGNTKFAYYAVPFKSSFDSLKGVVRNDLNEKNINKATLYLIDTITGDTIAFSTTNDNGKFEMTVPKRDDESIDERDLQLVIVGDGYEKKVINIDAQYFESEYLIVGNVDTKMKVEMKVEKVIEFHNIYFDYGKAELNQNSISVLDKIVQIMNENKKMVIELSAHTDCQSSSDFNFNLSQKRATNAKNYIISNGISQDRIAAKGYGKTRLLTHCDCLKCTEDEHALNRRIEVKILKMQ